MSSLPALRRVVAVCVLAIGSASVAGAVDITPADDLRAAVAGLRPGDELRLGAGTYALSNGFRVTANGTSAQPIVMRAKDGEHVIIRQTNASQNVIEISASRYFIVHGIEFTGGSHGIRLMDSDFVTIEDCEVHETGDVAISANAGGTYEGIRILRNHIHHTHGTGEGMYLGCVQNGCFIVNSLIEGNYVHHTNSADVEQGDGIEIKQGSYGNIVRDNVVHDTKYPGIITYSTLGNGPQNVIEGNVIWNTQDNSIQSAADSIIRNNVILGSPISLQAHENGSPSNLQIVHNTILASGDGIVVRNVSGPVIVSNNTVYSQSGTAIRLVSGNTGMVTVAGNVGHGGLSGASSGFTEGKGLAADFVSAQYGVPPLDVFPKPGSALIGAGNGTYVTPLDFNGTARAPQVDAGAYRYSASGNPGWRITAGFKGTSNVVRPNPPTNLRTVATTEVTTEW